MGAALRLHRGQRGLSAVELIITMALTGIVIGAIFSVYLLLYRVQTTWQDKSQARATGLLAEQSIQRDLERYKVGPKGTDRLLLTSASSTGDTTFSVEYIRDGTNRMQRTVRQGGTVVSSSIVAHGIRGFESWCSSEPPAPPGSGGLLVDPSLKVTLRNDPACGTLTLAMRVDTQ
jgi:hypothetical protein